MIRPRRTLLAVAVAGATIAALGGCASGGQPAPTGSTTASAQPTTGTGAAAEPSALPGGVTEAQAAELCSQMEAQLQSWRTYTPSMSKPGLNLLVGEWAARNGIDMLALAQDRDRVDTIASAQCPEVRSQALEALQIPTLASALVGF
ncbi:MULTISPECIES: hypothetical protein [Rhodococcus]|uniref:hypothetical protein n=1 Tax=Rhodococcus TaxID=1827 RepID=UPI00203CB7ED|nr:MULTISPECIES: hypothetical protein [Rhodococcus]USC13374.1 hypothetical protein KZJ41_16830 [Rhodococcus sp. 11-3]WFS14752.1 hypothetical protein P9K37_06675 [Rhodococcus aetherivorans]